MGLFDYAFNVVRNFSDLMHILLYLLIATFFFILSIYKFDKKIYKKYIYTPLTTTFNRYITFFVKDIINLILWYLKLVFDLCLPLILRLASSRLPYYIIAIRIKSKALFLKINKKKQKIKSFFKKKQ